MAKNWYVVHVYSGFEKKIAQQITEQAAQKGLADQFEAVLVPSENVVEVKRGRKINSEHKFFPGYVLVKMDLTDEAYHLVKNTPKVTGFLGSGSKPMPVSEKEVARIIGAIEEGVERPKPAIRFENGETVRVTDGPFQSFNGVVEQVDEERARLRVTVSIFGRATPVELEYSQVEKAQPPSAGTRASSAAVNSSRRAHSSRYQAIRPATCPASIRSRVTYSRAASPIPRAMSG